LAGQILWACSGLPAQPKGKEKGEGNFPFFY